MDPDRRKIMELALGRIFRMGSRPSQPGDVEEYERCRDIVMEGADEINAEWTPSWARDRLKSAQGD